MTDASLTFSGLTLGYNSHPAVHHLSGALARGSLTAVVGPNGSGKSTLLKGIVGILKPMAGRMSINGNARVAYLPQLSEVDRHFPARVYDLVALGLWSKLRLLGRVSTADKDAIARAIAAVGLTGFETRAINTLSGGQLQRALFARVIVQAADLILLDEPFNGVDTKTVTDLISLIKGWHDAGKTVLVVAHDVTLVREHFPQTMLLARQLIAWGETVAVLSEANLARARRFTEAWNDNAPWCDAPGDMDGQAHDHSHDHHHHAKDGHEHGHHHHHGEKETA